MKLSLLTDGFTISVLPRISVLETTEDCGRGLFVEIELRHWLAAG